ncbi:MAG: nodulation protein NfeD [Candidatus Aminicenantes bacterium]|nr:MAG: nodulation protein NfeD [Candidatus Aminicenantes bacterium]
MRKKRLFTVSIVSLLLFPVLLHSEIYTMKIDGPIETITEEYIVDSFKKVKEAPNAKLVIIEMDTPGGFSTSMRTIIKEIMASPVPVAVYVSPKGAQAASAGFFIAIASDIASMSPGTNTGAAHPVSVSGSKIEDTMKEKVTNDAVAYARSLARTRNRNQDLAEKAVRESKSYTAEECLKNNLIEYIAENIDDLLKQLEGKTITRVNGKTTVLAFKGESIIPLDLSGRQKFLKTITNPTLAYFLLIFGLLGLYLEFTHPGIIIPGVLGGICLLLAFLAFQVLPINYVGLLLILLAIGFFIAEVKIQGFGMFGIGGIISFVLGSIMLINSPIPEMRPNMLTIIVFSLAFAAVFMFLAFKVIQAMRRGTETGQEGLAGEVGVAKTEINATSGKVFVHGEWWNAVTVSEFDETISAGTKIKVESVEGFILKVTPILTTSNGGG